MVLLYRSQDLVFPTSQVGRRTDFPQPVLRVSPLRAQQVLSPLRAGFSRDCMGCVCEGGRVRGHPAGQKLRHAI